MIPLCRSAAALAVPASVLGAASAGAMPGGPPIGCA